MRIPAYLTVSRHGVYYFRYPIAVTLHPSASATTLKLSLRTRDTRQALDLSRRLSYVANLLCQHGADSRMTYAEIRAMLKEHFSSMLALKKQAMADDGPLTPLEVYCLESDVAGSRGAATDSIQDHLKLFAFDSMIVDDILRKYGKSTSLQEGDRRALLNEYRKANSVYAKAVLDHDGSTHGYELDGTQNAVAALKISGTKSGSTTLGELVVAFFKFAAIENRWIGKTKGEKEEHVSLLFEALGKDTDIARVDRRAARDIRDMLSTYPVNRFKMADTKGKSLTEIREGKWKRTLHPLTINKYLQTYNTLFGWAKGNGYVAENPFEGLSLNTSKANKEPPRLPFSTDALDSILNALLGKDVAIQPHHRWGSLSALHMGARLNEVAQLDLDDVTLRDDIWCVDINANGPRKKLKNAASKRVVPIHPRLIDLGLLDYAKDMRGLAGNTRLFPQLTYTTSDGYGRNLGRWFNESLLPSLGVKSKQHTFHSLRHSVIERLIAADVSQAHIMAIVGHETGTTTLKTYNRNGFPPRQLLDALTQIFRPKVPAMNAAANAQAMRLDQDRL